MSTTKKVEMEYLGPEVDETNKPKNIKVDESEVAALVKAGGWAKVKKGQTAETTTVVEAAQPEKEVSDG